MDGYINYDYATANLGYIDSQGLTYAPSPSYDPATYNQPAMLAASYLSSGDGFASNGHDPPAYYYTADGQVIWHYAEPSQAWLEMEQLGYAQPFVQYYVADEDFGNEVYTDTAATYRPEANPVLADGWNEGGLFTVPSNWAAGHIVDAVQPVDHREVFNGKGTFGSSKLNANAPVWVPAKAHATETEVEPLSTPPEGLTAMENSALNTGTQTVMGEKRASNCSPASGSDASHLDVGVHGISTKTATSPRQQALDRNILEWYQGVCQRFWEDRGVKMMPDILEEDEDMDGLATQLSPKESSPPSAKDERDDVFSLREEADVETPPSTVSQISVVSCDYALEERYQRLLAMRVNAWLAGVLEPLPDLYISESGAHRVTTKNVEPFLGADSHDEHDHTPENDKVAAHGCNLDSHNTHTTAENNLKPDHDVQSDGQHDAKSKIALNVLGSHRRFSDECTARLASKTLSSNIKHGQAKSQLPPLPKNEIKSFVPREHNRLSKKATRKRRHAEKATKAGGNEMIKEGLP
ncbi:hypothetical protein K490DRAFT_65166 [Saccharata proteae CBS 121410]|uniref:Uncharacterized protein n=1 Tax=Saccharata proteae CBS 121410 TaxID=1314787 RepID=A0A9P4HW68_9PEZI|nr:hypothetical protein K490DRAFT_65166 [Saccharata proteae CBS 121410]